MARKAKRPSDDVIEQALASAGTVAGAARVLGVPRTTLSSWIHDQGPTAPDALEPEKRKLTDAVNKSGQLEARDLKNPDELIAEHGLQINEWEVAKVDVSKRDAGTAKDPRITHALAVTLQRKVELPERANEGNKTVFKARPKRTSKRTDRKLYVILGDEQAPNGLDEELHERVCQFLRDVQPDEVIHIGDLGDFESVSSYTQLNPGQWSNSVQECLDSSYQILGNYRANLPADTRFRYLIGNHEVRLQRYLLNQAKEIYGVGRAGEAGQSVLDLAYLLRLDELDIELIGSDMGTYPHPAIEIVPNKLVAVHGDVARRRSGTSPHAASEGTSYGIIHGHTHRAAVVSRRVNGTRKSQQLQSAEIGCLCKPNGLGYSSSRTTDWQQGFATVSVWDDSHYHIDLASYQNGVLVWNGERWS